MADFRVTFVGNLGNLAQFNSAIRSSFAANASALRQANQGIVSQALGRRVQGIDVPLAQTKTAGLYLQNARTEFDHFNNSVVQSGQLIERYVSGYDRALNRLTGKVEVKPIFSDAYTTNFQKATTHMQEYLRVTAQLAPVEKQLLSIEKTAQGRFSFYDNAQIPLTRASKSINPLFSVDKPAAGSTEQWTDIAKRNDRYFQDLFRNLKAQNLLGQVPIFTHTNADGPLDTQTYLNPATAGWKDLKATIINSGGQITSDFKAFAAQIAKTSDYIDLRLKRAAATSQAQAAAVNNDPLTKSLRKYQQNLFNVPEGIDTQSYRVLENQAVIRNDLIKRGQLGGGAQYGSQQFFASAKNSEFQITDVSKDISQGLTRVSGQMRDANGVLNTFNYNIDKSGKVVDSWGRRLYSSGGFLNETASRLIRFTEFMVGATIVLGSFSLALNSITKINEINSSLQRFAITARLNDAELKEMFKSFAQVAQATATPLSELITASDDIALATRRANQSTDEWRVSMIELATAVGIFTNITGESTTKATEQLVAIMQQLNLSTKELTPLLSQITAAAGGQAASITDIAEGLASLAEAASEAGLSVTEQIAATQVISLATGKTASETAAAFKALFGAINSDASIKKLAEFNIAVRDTEGNLKPFLEIYSEVADAINRGVIPGGRVNEVLRAISGGPRRSPDAAALLANVGKVFEVEKIAQGATNEALIANAQILTTNKARITQFQSAWDMALYEQLNKTLEDLTATLADFGTAFAKIFEIIPQGLVSFTTQLVAFYTAFSLLGKIAGSIGLTKLFDSLGKGFSNVASSAKAASTGVSSASTAISTAGALKPPVYRQTDATGIVGRPQYLSSGRFMSDAKYDAYLRDMAARESESSARPFRTDSAGKFQYLGGGYVPSAVAKEAMAQAEKGIIQAHTTGAKSFTSTLKNFFSGPNIKAAALSTIGGGLLGGASSLASGGSSVQAAAQAAQFASFGAFMTANPLGIAAGIGLGGVSIALGKIAEDEEKVKTKTQELQLSLYNLTQEWKINQASVDAAQLTYDDIKMSLAAVEEGSKEYKDLQTKLGQATVGLSSNIDTQRESLEKMLEVLNQLKDLQGDKGPNWGAYISDILSQNLSPELLKEIQGDLAEAIYAASGQGVISSSTPIAFDPSTLTYGQGTTNPVRLGPTPSDQNGTEYTANDLRNDPNAIKAILGEISSLQPGVDPYNNSRVQFPFSNQDAVSSFRAGLATLLKAGEINQAAVDTFEAAVNQFKFATSVTSQSIQGYSAGLEGKYITGQLTPEQYKSGQLRVEIAKDLQGELAQAIAEISKVAPDDRDEQRDVAQSIATRINSLLTNANGSPNISAFGSDDVTSLRSAAIGEISQQEGWGGIRDDVDAVNGAIAAQLELWGADQDIIDLIIGKTKELASTTVDELNIMKQATDDWANSQLQSVGDQLLNLQARFQGGEFSGKGGSTQYAFLRTQLLELQASIIAVADASKTMEETLVNNLGLEGVADATGIVLDGLNNLNINGFQGVAHNVEALNGAFFNWIRTLNLSDKQMGTVVRNWIRLMALAAQAAVMMNSAIALSSGTYKGTSGPSSISTATGQIGVVDAQIAAILREMKQIGSAATGTYIPGTKTGTSTGTKATTDTLYLSEEQQKLADPLSLVKQAYQDALKLQSQIPGETKKNRLNTVVVFDELQKIFSARGVSEELLRRALDNLTGEMEKANQKADVVRRIRVGAGDFSAIANVPLNSTSGVSVAGTNQINITFNLNGTNLTPAEFDKFANMIGAEIARRL